MSQMVCKREFQRTFVSAQMKDLDPIKDKRAEGVIGGRALVGV